MDPSVNNPKAGGEQGLQAPSPSLPSFQKYFRLREAVLSYFRPISEDFCSFKPIFKTQDDEGPPDKLQFHPLICGG